MNRFLAVTALAFAFSASGCVADTSHDDAAATDGEALSATSGTSLVTTDGTEAEQQVRTGGLTVWFDGVGKPGFAADGHPQVRVRGRASRDLTNVFSFVPDDAYGTATLTGPRSFEVLMDSAGEVNTWLSGMPIFVGIQTSTGTPTSFTARIDLAPRFARFQGASAIFVDKAVTPVYVDDGLTNLRYRGTAHVTGNAALTAFTDEHADPTVTKVGGAFQLDWDFDTFHAAYTPPSEPVHFSAKVSGSPVAKTAEIHVGVARIGLTTEDAYTVWPTAQCEKSVLACVKAKPTGTKDFGACGTYRQVSVCKYLADGKLASSRRGQPCDSVGWRGDRGR